MAETDHTDYRLTRDNAKDLVFSGVKLAAADNSWIAGQEQNRFTRLELYRTKSGKYILAEEYVTRWQGESGRESADVYDTAEELVEALEIEDGAISNLHYELITEAAKHDDAFEGLMEEHVD